MTSDKKPEKTAPSKSPPPPAAPEADPPRWLGFDLGGTKMLAVVFDEHYQPLGQKRRRTRGNEGAKAGVKRILQTIEQALEDAKIDLSEIGGLGIGCPGPIDPHRGLVREMVNLGWRDLPLRKLLEEELRIPVAVLNDVDAGVYGEYVAGAARGASTVLGVFPGTGIGGGCVANGEIVSGKNITAMEIGHIQVVADGDLCGCGRRGCLETRASRLAIAGQAAQASYRGAAPFLHKEIGADVAEIRSGVLAKAIKNGDKVVELIVRQAAHDLGVAVASIIHLLAPDRIVLGGGMVEAMQDLWVEEVLKAARHRVMVPYRDSFEVVTAKLGDYAAALGAAAWVRKTAASAPPLADAPGPSPPKSRDPLPATTRTPKP